MCSPLKEWDIYHHHMVGLSVTTALHLPFPQMTAGWPFWSSSSKFWGGLAEVKGKFMDQQTRVFWNQRELQTICSGKTRLRSRSATTLLFSETQVALDKTFPFHTEPVKIHALMTLICEYTFTRFEGFPNNWIERWQKKICALTQCFPGNLKLMSFTLLEIENKLSDCLRRILGILATAAAAKAKPSKSALYWRQVIFYGLNEGHDQHDPFANGTIFLLYKTSLLANKTAAKGFLTNLPCKVKPGTSRNLKGLDIASYKIR